MQQLTLTNLRTMSSFSFSLVPPPGLGIAPSKSEWAGFALVAARTSRLILNGNLGVTVTCCAIMPPCECSGCGKWGSTGRRNWGEGPEGNADHGEAEQVDLCPSDVVYELYDVVGEVVHGVWLIDACERDRRAAHPPVVKDEHCTHTKPGSVGHLDVRLRGRRAHLGAIWQGIVRGGASRRAPQSSSCTIQPHQNLKRVAEPLVVCTHPCTNTNGVLALSLPRTLYPNRPAPSGRSNIEYANGG